MLSVPGGDHEPVGVDVGQPLEALVVHRVVGADDGQPDTAHQLGGVLVLATEAEAARLVELDPGHARRRLAAPPGGQVV